MTTKQLFFALREASPCNCNHYKKRHTEGCRKRAVDNAIRTVERRIKNEEQRIKLKLLGINPLP